jgi:hypothetical protein
VPSIVGVVGALCEALWSNRPLARWFFILGLVASIFFATQRDHPPLFAPIFLVAPFVLGFGCFAWISRYRRVREEKRVIELAARDLAEARALELSGVPDLGVDPPSRLTRTGLKPKKDDAERQFSVLPHSGLLLPRDGLRVDEWVVLDVIRTAELESTPITAAVPGFVMRDPQLDLRQRHMTAAETQEIERHRRQLLFRAGWMFLVFGYIAARLVQGGQMALGMSQPSMVRVGGWAIAALGGLVWTIPALRLRAKLGSALAVRKVFIVSGRPTGSDLELHEELLAENVAWTVQHEPAEWRRRKF